MIPARREASVGMSAIDWDPFRRFYLNDGDPAGGGGGGGGTGTGNGGGSGDPGAGGGGDPGASGGDPGAAGGDPGKKPADRPSGDRRPVEEMSEEDLRTELRATRGEAANYRRELQTVRGELTSLTDWKRQIEEKDKSEADKAKSEAQREKERADKLNDDLRLERAHNQAITVATSKAAHDPEAVWRLVDQKAVEYDDEDKPTNVQALVEDAMKDRTWLVDQTRKPSTANGPKTPSAEPKTPQERLKAAYSQPAK
jgi:hypothetical protein